MDAPKNEYERSAYILITPDPPDGADRLLPDDLDHDFPEMPEGDENECPTLIIPNEMQAERHLKAVSYYRREAQRIAAHAQAHRAQIDAWEQARLRPIEARAAWHEGGLRGWFAGVGRKSVKLVYGSLQVVAGRDRVEVTDFAALNKAVGEGVGEMYNLIRLKAEPDKTGIARFIKETGEVPPGCDLVRGEDRVKIETV